MDLDDNQDELKKLAPTLFELKKDSGFIAPQGFFDHFPHNVQDAVKEVHAGVQMPFWKGLVIALPLIIVLIAVSGILIKMTGDDDVPAFGGVDKYEIETILAYEDAEALLAVLEDEDLPAEVFTSNVSLEALSEEEIETIIEEL